MDFTEESSVTILLGVHECGRFLVSATKGGQGKREKIHYYYYYFFFLFFYFVLAFVVVVVVVALFMISFFLFPLFILVFLLLSPWLGPSSIRPESLEVFAVCCFLLFFVSYGMAGFFLLFYFPLSFVFCFFFLVVDQLISDDRLRSLLEP